VLPALLCLWMVMPKDTRSTVQKARRNSITVEKGEFRNTHARYFPNCLRAFAGYGVWHGLVWLLGL
jgi:hypothetical protein